MSAIIHCIITEIENERLINLIKIWRYKIYIHKNKQMLIRKFKYINECTINYSLFNIGKGIILCNIL